MTCHAVKTKSCNWSTLWVCHGEDALDRRAFSALVRSASSAAVLTLAMA
jgi:hypothetical protein